VASVDVIVPSYQYGRYLRQCVKSILTQEHTDLRVLIIDNASTDNSVEVACEFRAEDLRVEVVTREKNLGGAASYNEGIDRAVADYITYVCADDLMAPGFLSGAVSILERGKDIVFAYGREAFFREGDEFPIFEQQTAKIGWQIVEGTNFIETICRRPHATPTVVRTSVQKIAGYYRPELPFTDDVEMLLRLALRGRVAQTTAIGGVRRFHNSNISVRAWKDRMTAINAQEAAFETFFADEGRVLPNAQRLHAIAMRTTAARAYWWAVGDLLRGKWDTAFRLLKRAIRLSPRMAIIPPLGFLLRAEGPLGRIARGLSGPLPSEGTKVVHSVSEMTPCG
jgi:glycosyltransferase involved in cell wall biosynthesis